MNIIVDYGLGNLSSVSRAFERQGIETAISSDKEDIKNADCIILPGVGAFRDAIRLLKESGLDDLIRKEAQNNKMIIGICLGMQLLYEKSFENGQFQGLGLIKGQIRKIETDFKIPHMGWNDLYFEKKDDPILKYIKEGDYVYFVHSYQAPEDGDEVVAYCDYGARIPAIVRNKNIYGIQFHPEKSAKVGAAIIKAYKEMI